MYQLWGCLEEGVKIAMVGVSLRSLACGAAAVSAARSCERGSWMGQGLQARPRLLA